jgi:hypothetical protein
MKKYLIISFLALLYSNRSNGQVLISLLLGDKINSGKLEFGLDGGANWSNISNLDEGKGTVGFNLGFYFDFKMNEKLYIHTGVIVKSPMGSKDLSPYLLGNDDLDSVLSTGSVRRKLRYFNVPVFLKYRFVDHFFAEFGPQVGWLHKAIDEFSTELFEKNDLTFQNNIRDEYRRIDAGITLGLGYRLMKGNGMNLGIRYYCGLVNILKENPNGSQRNSSLYLFVGIPIGAGKAEEKTKSNTN